ncbi:hypothetical protein B296_00000770 [Ensete ventricosum]|uniref:Uncharacterized protein n=1 Tax=Ensete ventricosum TaxID=4639 RepID=A0A427B984_ENSVE|nr:hypothetical protein B296_00000770 [Ensete ventricosum]
MHAGVLGELDHTLGIDLAPLWRSSDRHGMTGQDMPYHTLHSPPTQGVVPRENREVWLEMGVCPFIGLVLVLVDFVNKASWTN